ncbi:MAG: HAD-IA family hydrolase [Chthoniobacteraceae bacterium]
MLRDSAPRVIFFDAAGTLFHLPQGVGFHYREVLSRHGIVREEAALEAAFREVWQTMEAPALSEGPRMDDDRGWWREVVERVLDRCEVVPGKLNRGPFFDELYAEFVKPAVWRLYPEVEDVLTTLGRRFALGVITNFDGRFRAIADQLGIARHFRHIIISSEVGADKPAPLIFERALTIAGVAAGEALHVGDDPVCDWQGAERAGLSVFRLDRPRNDLRDLLALAATTPRPS